MSIVTDDYDYDEELRDKVSIDAAFRSSQTNQAYLFVQDEYVVLDYVDNKLLKGPALVCDADQFKSLRSTPFEAYGIECAFRSVLDDEEAFIFTYYYCALINYKHHSLKIRPMPIRYMFPFLEDTGFKTSLNAAFELTKQPRAYLFKGNQYALIDYGPDGRLISTGLITDAFPSLKGTIFESGIDAAFASHNDNEAYVFKGNSYALINFPTPITPHSIPSVKEILLDWPSLHGFLPRKNYSLIFPVYKDRLHFSDEEDGDLKDGEIYVPIYPSDHSDVEPPQEISVI